MSYLSFKDFLGPDPIRRDPLISTQAKKRRISEGPVSAGERLKRRAELKKERPCPADVKTRFRRKLRREASKK